MAFVRREDESVNDDRFCCFIFVWPVIKAYGKAFVKQQIFQHDFKIHVVIFFLS